MRWIARAVRSGLLPGAVLRMISTGLSGFQSPAAPHAAAQVSAATRHVARANQRITLDGGLRGAPSTLRAVVRADREARGACRAVAPRVIGAALDHDVALSERDLLRIEHEHDLAFEHHREFERARFLHV